MKRSEILDAARKCVCGEREKEYGSPENNFHTIALLWTVYLRDRLKADIRPEDVAAMLALLKIARIASGNAKEDNWIDLAGYAACGGEIETAREGKMGLNSSDLARLGPNAQKQVLQKLGAQQRQRENKGKKPNKYNAKPTDVVMPDGTVRHFSSEKEANRFRELDLLQRAGEIKDLRCQVPFELIPRQQREDGKWEQPCKYIADFVYRDGCHMVVEDVKGYNDPKSAAYKLYTVKRKLMLLIHGITIKEI